MTEPDDLSPWWRIAAFLVLIGGFSVLIALSVRVYSDAPPVPGRAVAPTGETVFTGEDVRAGQAVFLRYGLMENGTVWGHGAYLGPDFPADYLRAVAAETRADVAAPPASEPARAAAVEAEVALRLKENRYDPAADVLRLTAAEVRTFPREVERWRAYFADPLVSRGLRSALGRNPGEIRQLTAFFAWAAWASAAKRPGHDYSYTNNFPYAPEAGNTPTKEAVLWSALSLIFLLGGTAAVLFAFGRFDYLGWKGQAGHVHPSLIPGLATESQRATLAYFAVAAALFLAQVVLGGATAHFRADPGSFYGLDLSRILPSQLARTWHLQLAIFWVATCFVAGGLFLAPALGGREPKGQALGARALLAALVVVVCGSLLGEWAGIRGGLGKLWSWFGDQGWEYLDLGRAWQVGLAAGLVFWLFLVLRGVAPARKDPERSEIASLFIAAAAAIPVFYVPAFFYGSTTNFSIVDTWRFWIIHLWVEGFFELFVTVMVSVIFFRLGLVSRTTARRVIYLDAVLYLGSGVIGTGHHWYFNGQSAVTMAFAAMFSALEVVPLTLLTLDASDFVRLGEAVCVTCGTRVSVPHRWTFRFLMAVGFWNFVGAGVFGFLINLPIVSYFEVGTILTPNHGHAAMMGVFGMLAVALMVFAWRQVLSDADWTGIEPLVRLAFWGLNVGLALMVVSNLFPGGVLQLWDVLQNGYAHARGPEFLDSRLVRAIEWARLPGDLVFIGAGAAPLALAGLKALRAVRRGGTPNPTRAS